MWYDLHLIGQDGSKEVIRYNPHTSQMEGLEVTTNMPRPAFKTVQPVSKSAPVGKSHAPHRLKIQMGLACNYSCSYCSQAMHIQTATISLTSDADRFLANLDTWLHEAPKEIELWGGEPFVYWAKLKKLVPALRGKFPEAEFSIITNGSVLDREKLDFIAAHDIRIAISHDGPGQHLRGPDPLDDPEKRRWIEALLAERKGKVGFNVVLTNESFSLSQIAAWFYDQLGDVDLGIEGIVDTYDTGTMLGSGAFTPDQLRAVSDSIFYQIASGGHDFGLGERIQDFLLTVAHARPIETVGQKCGMDRPDDIAVDLQGNVMTCQNTGAKGTHKIGHVSEFDKIALNTSTHFSLREACMHCPVVQLCRGSCMYLDGPLFAQSCHNSYALNLGILRAALFKLTGKVLTRIEGDIRRPDANVPGFGFGG